MSEDLPKSKIVQEVRKALLNKTEDLPKSKIVQEVRKANVDRMLRTRY